MLRTDDERKLERFVIGVARLYGWCGFHVSFSRGAVTGVHAFGVGDDHYDSDGWPDWVFVRDRVLYRELKGAGKYPKPPQRRWGEKLVAAGADWKVWWPKDQAEIVATFSRPAAVS